MDEIRAKAYWTKGRPGRLGLAPLPAGWVIRNVDTGSQIGRATPYPTEAEAIAAIPAALAALQIRLDERAALDAQRAAEQVEAERTASTRSYRTVSRSLGHGRIYDDQPGATQYDDGTGRYKVQIWDNA